MKTQLLATTIVLMSSYVLAQEAGKPTKAPTNTAKQQAKVNAATDTKESIKNSNEKDDDMTPGELSKKVLAAAAEIKATKSFDEKLTRLAVLEKAVEADADKTTVEGIRYSVSLEPLLKNRKNLKEKMTCLNVRNETEYLFTSGSGFRGKLHYFAKDSLQLLAAVCDNPELAKFEN